MLGSSLEPTGRHIVLTLLSRTDAATAEIPPQYCPSFTELEKLTAYSRSTLIEWMKVLTESHWVARFDADGASRQGMRLTPGDPNAARPKRARASKKTDAPYRQAVRNDGADVPPGGTDHTAWRYGAIPPGGTTPSPHCLKENSPTESSNPVDRDQSATGADDPHDGTLGVDFGKPVAPEQRGRKTKTKSAPKTAGEETAGQRLNRVTKLYTDVVKLSHFFKAKAVVEAAFEAGYSEQQISDGIRRLAEKEDPLTKDSLRIAIKGRPSWASRDQNSNPGNYRNPADDSVYDDWSAVTR